MTQTTSSGKTQKKDRKTEILQSMAILLEKSDGGRITTASLANHLSISEAALYRHFSSKAQIFEGLISFLEQSIFTRIKQILQDTPSSRRRCEQIIVLVLSFCSKNPGFCRLLIGDTIAQENTELYLRICRLYNRLETQFTQILKEGKLNGEISPKINTVATSAIFINIIEGKINHYIRNKFTTSPMAELKEQWNTIYPSIFELQTEESIL